MAQSTVSHFLNGKPVDYANFIEICRGLGQEWRDIADFEANSEPEEVVLVRAKVAIVFEGFPSDRFANANARSDLTQNPCSAVTPSFECGRPRGLFY